MLGPRRKKETSRKEVSRGLNPVTTATLQYVCVCVWLQVASALFTAHKPTSPPASSTGKLGRQWGMPNFLLVGNTNLVFSMQLIYYRNSQEPSRYTSFLKRRSTGVYCDLQNHAGVLTGAREFSMSVPWKIGTGGSYSCVPCLIDCQGVLYCRHSAWKQCPLAN